MYSTLGLLSVMWVILRMFFAFIKQNAKAFSLDAIVDVCRQRRRHEIIFLISRKLLEIATSKFITNWLSIVFTFRPEMTS